MNDKRRPFQCLVLVLVFLLQSISPAAGQAELRPGATTVGGIINTDTTWTMAGSPYEAASTVTVVSNVTLTIEPGVEVRFAPNTRLAINGALHALGEAGQEILFTGSTQAPGSWQGVWITAASGIRSLDNRLQHVVVEYGGSGIADPANLYLTGADVVIEHSQVRNSGGNGLTAKTDVLAEIADTQFTGNAGMAARFFEIANDPALARLSAGGNGADAVGIGGVSNVLVGAHTWEQMGLPYVAYNIITVDPRGQVYVDPGVEIRFAAAARLDVRGSLTALGTEDQPILFTGVDKVRGAWDGLNFLGTFVGYAVGEFRYATIEYGGGGSNAANIYATTGRVTLDHSVVRNSLSDGLRLAAFGSRSSISASQIYGNAGYGVRNSDTSYPVVAVASNNWWGNASGPRPDTACNPGAAGDRVSANVVFEPFLTEGTANPGPTPASGVHTISISPRRWYAPAGGTKVYVDIAVYDGTGRPAPGRKVVLNTTWGSVQIGPVTGADGKVIATVSAGSPGEAQLTATLEDLDCWSSALSETAAITFEQAEAAVVFPDTPAPYVNHSLKIDPLPVIVGVPTNLIAELTNPFDFDVYVDAVFGYAQAGIGLAFGPAGEVFDFLIPAGQTRTMAVEWTPQVSGHICIQFDYTLYKLVEGGALSENVIKLPVAKGSSQENTDPYPGSNLSPDAKNALNEGTYWQSFVSDMTELVDAISDLGSLVGNFIMDQMVDNLLGFINGAGSGIVCGTGGGTECAGYDGPELQLPGGSVGTVREEPPRQDYTIVAVPETYTYPTQAPGPDMPAARAEAFNRVLAASFDLMGKQWAMVLSNDRYGGATKAKDLAWASVQANAYIFYMDETAKAMIAYEKAIEDLIAELKAEGYTDIVRTQEEWQAYQDRLSAEGWSDVERQAAALTGITPEGLELIRQTYLSANPAGMEGSLYDRLQYRADLYGDVGRMMQNPPKLGPVTTMGGKLVPSAPGDEPAETHPLARLSPIHPTIQVGNPLTTTATVDLEVRPLGLPADWVVTLSESSLELAPGESVTVTVMIRPGLPVPQGAQPGIAVEGFVDGRLIGGVAIDVLVPVYVDFTRPYKAYLPVLPRK